MVVVVLIALIVLILLELLVTATELPATWSALELLIGYLLILESTQPDRLVLVRVLLH